MKRLSIIIAVASALLAAGCANSNDSTINSECIQGVQLWEDGPYWAPFNIGATKPEQYGLYFQWGNTTGYTPDGDTFSFNFNKNDYSSTTGRGLPGNLPSDATYDAARANWGGKWRIPTDEEYVTLLNEDNSNRTTHELTTRKGVRGLLIKGTGAYSKNSIFLPAAGSGNGSALDYSGAYGYYWSSTFCSVNYVCGLYFDSGNAYTHYEYRHYGAPVRAVSDK